MNSGIGKDFDIADMYALKSREGNGESRATMVVGIDVEAARETYPLYLLKLSCVLNFEGRSGERDNNGTEIDAKSFPPWSHPDQCIESSSRRCQLTWH